MIETEASLCVVAVQRERVCGFGQMRDGNIGSLYVSPLARFCGASHQMLGWLESQAVRLGYDQVSLSSSSTALRFYRDRGYESTGEATPGFGRTLSWPLAKRIVPQ